MTMTWERWRQLPFTGKRNHLTFTLVGARATAARIGCTVIDVIRSWLPTPDT